MSQNDQMSTICCPGIEDLFPHKFFKALGDPNRIRILIQLARCGKPCTVTELTGCCNVDFSVVSRHLNSLREAGIVEAEKQGRKMLYRARLQDVTLSLRKMADVLYEASTQQSSQNEERV